MRRERDHHTPPWWPEGEAWPPGRSPWHDRGHNFRYRVAGLLGLVLPLAFFGAFALLRTVSGDGPPGRGRVWPIALAVILFVFVFARTMRRVGRPMGDVVSAAERVASGDFDVRVREYGPPWLRSVAAAFNTMVTRLESQRRQRRDLMADIAHELRTPLSVMQGRLEGMLDGVYPRDEHHVGQVLEETRLLARLVEDLRTLAHSESGTLALQKEPTDLGVLLDEMLTSFAPEALARGVTVTADIPTELPLIEIDPIRIREVVTNLLSNAVRYSSTESTVRIDAEAQRDTIIVRVRDNGPGISASDLAHIFNRFYKGAASTGSGLGLTIARSLVIAHGGTITAESRVGAGTAVIVTLPLFRGQSPS